MIFSWEQIRQDVGGRWFLDRKSLLILAPYLLVISLLSANVVQDSSWVTGLDSFQRYSLLLLANVLSLVICWAYLELAAATVFRNRASKPAAISTVIGFGASLGFLKGITTGYLSWMLGVEDELRTALTDRILQTSLSGMWTVPLVALGAATLAKYRLERELLLAEKVEQALKDPGFLSSNKNSMALSELMTASRASLAALKEQVANSLGSAGVATQLRAIIETELRPLSHKIWDQEKTNKTRATLPDVLFLALRKNPFPLRIIGTGLLLGHFPLNLVVFPVLEAIARSGLLVCIALAILALMRRIPRPNKATSVLVVIFGNLLATFGTIAGSLLIFQMPLSFGEVGSWAALFFWLVQLSVFASLATEVVRSRVEIRSELLDLVGETGLDSEVLMATARINNKALAQYVHSNLQNKLFTSALKLESRPLNPIEISHILSEVEALLNAEPSDYLRVSTKSIAEQLRELADRWDGFVAVELMTDKGKEKMDPQVAGPLMLAAEEAVSNAVRHGLASKITVQLIQGEGEILLVVTDDGIGPRSGAAGLGTELFDALSGKHWQLTHIDSGGSRLVLRTSISN